MSIAFTRKRDTPTWSICNSVGTMAAGAVNIRQRELTTAVEAREIADLRDDFAALPADDRRRQAFFQISGPLCNEWVTTLPDTIGFFTTAEFRP